MKSHPYHFLLSLGYRNFNIFSLIPYIPQLTFHSGFDNPQYKRLLDAKGVL